MRFYEWLTPAFFLVFASERTSGRSGVYSGRSFFGRYHYAIDVIIGAVLAFVSFWIFA
jgi:hypothetical protein